MYGSRTCKPNSVCLAAGRSFLWATHCCGAQATYPEVVAHRAGTPSAIAANSWLSRRPSRACSEGENPSLFGLAPCGVCPARSITATAVRSYRTFSPLPRRRSGPVVKDPRLAPKERTPSRSTTTTRRYVFCGTFRRTLPPILARVSSRTLSGTLLCGVRTFLCFTTATVRSGCLLVHYSAGG